MSRRLHSTELSCTTSESMSNIVKTEAVVLKSMKYRESSKIMTFLTPQFGKISAFVKGARNLKSKYGSSLEPMSYVLIVVYHKDGREIQTVSQCDLMKSFRNLYEHIDKMAAGMEMIELVAIVSHEQEANVSLFSLLVNSLTTLNDATKNPRNVLYKFGIELAGILGFRPGFGGCVACGATVMEGIGTPGTIEYHLGKGGPLCLAHHLTPGPKVSLFSGVFWSLRQFASSRNIVGVLDIGLDENSRCEIEAFILSFLRYHVSGMRRLKSEKVFAKILSTP